MLSSADGGHKVGVHHSSLEDDTRRLVEDQYKQGILSIVIATIGFGMVFSNNTLQDPVNKIYYKIYCRALIFLTYVSLSYGAYQTRSKRCFK